MASAIPPISQTIGTNPTGSSSTTTSTATSKEHPLVEFVDKIVSVITNDGRNIIGTLKGYDQTINIILDQSHERVFSMEKGVLQNVLGLYLIRGDNIAMIGEYDEEKDSRIDLSSVRANPLKPVTHS